MLTWIILTLGVGFLRAEMNTVSNVSVSTLEGVTFTGTIYDMKADCDGSCFFVVDNNALWRLDLETKNKTLIAGSSERGYVEGVGAAARFDSPGGINVSQARLIVSDSYNHCLREVDLVSHQTSRLTGICKFRGFRDGSLRDALFYYPLGYLSHYSGVLVADRGNHAIRLVEGGMVATIVSGPPVKWPNYLIEMEGQVFISMDTGLLRLDPFTKSVELVAGSESEEGFTDGPLLSARFSWPRELVRLAPGLLLVIDYRLNNRVRLVDLVNDKVSSICTGKPDTLDGSDDECQLYLPWSIEILAETIYIGQSDGRVRTLPLEAFIGVGNVCPPSDIELTLKAEEDYAKVNVSNAELWLPVGESKSITWLEDGTICTTSINVTGHEACPPSHVNLQMKPGENTTDFRIHDIINAHLDRGQHEVETTLRNGTVCLTVINVTDAVKLICPSNIDMGIDQKETVANVTWKEPELVGASENEVQCSSCPAQQQQLATGIHWITYIYIYLPTNSSFSCSFQVVVIKSGLLPCESEVVLGIKKDEQEASFIIKSENGNVTPINLAVGAHTFEVVSQSGINCSQTVKVYDNKVIGRDVMLKVSYPMTCSCLNDLTLNIIKSFLLQEYTDLARTCIECRLVDEPVSPDVDCRSDLLSVSWKTNISISLEELDLSNSTKDEVNSDLRKVQEDNMKWNGRFLNITVLTFTPPIISPVVDNNGLCLSLVVVSSCPLPEMIYNNIDDVCYLPD